MLLRLDKIISSTGKATRSEVKTLVRRGKVTVNGAQAVSAQDKYDPERDAIYLNGERISFCLNHYYMMNKPAGCVTSTDDPVSETVMDILPEEQKKQNLFPAGRLDKDTEGLLILTDDGELAHRIMSPKHHVSKLYYAEVDGTLCEEDENAFIKGLILGDGTKCESAVLKILEIEGKNAVHVTVREGKYHQVKRMLASRGAPVKYLKRLRIGALRLDESLKPGEIRPLTPEETEMLKRNEK